jgi:hypothetical protein
VTGYIVKGDRQITLGKVTPKAARIAMEAATRYHDASELSHRPEFNGPRNELAEKDLEVLFRDGVVILPNLLSPELCAELKATVKTIGKQESEDTGRREFGRGAFEGTSTKRVYGLASKSPLFDSVLLHPRILAIMDRGLSPGYLLHTCQSTEIFPGEKRQG